MSERINEHDMTKKMMEIMRGGYASKLIIENDGGMAEQKVLDIQQGDAVYNEELKKLRAINNRVDIKFFKIYTDKENSNVHMGVVYLQGPIGSDDGTSNPNQQNSWMNEGNRSGVYFELSLLDGYKEPVVKNVSNPDLSQLLKQLPGFYQNWEDEWAVKLQDDYVGRQNQ